MLSGIVSHKKFMSFYGQLIDELESAEEIKFYPGYNFSLAEAPWQRKHGKEIKYNTDKLNHTVYTFTQDHNFPDYAANLIPDTNLVAAIGPINTEYAARLLKSTVFNNYFPIATIVCFGTHGKIKLDGQLDLMRDDFINYFMQKNKVSFSTGNNQYFVKSTLMKKSQQIQHYQLDCRHGDEEKTLNVYLYITPDGHPFIPKTAEDIQLAIQVSEITKSEYVLSHCHAGVGRTGQFILQNIINARFSELVDFSDVMKSVKNIQMVLEMIRQTRPAFIHSKAQLLAAVGTAFKIEKVKLEIRNASSQTVESDALLTFENARVDNCNRVAVTPVRENQNSNNEETETASNGMLTSSKPNLVLLKTLKRFAENEAARLNHRYIWRGREKARAINDALMNHAFSDLEKIEINFESRPSYTSAAQDSGLFAAFGMHRHKYKEAKNIKTGSIEKLEATLPEIKYNFQT